MTGASRGIGRAVAEGLLAEGRHVCAVARDADALFRLYENRAGASWLAVDLADRKERGFLVERARAAIGPLDGVVLAAGIAVHRPAVEADDDIVSAQWEVNALASFAIARDTARTMIADGISGSIVALASTLAHRGAQGTAGYAMSKAALVAGMRGLALELGHRGIRVNSVLPGVVDTDMVRDRTAVPDARERLAGLHILGRIGTAAEVASSVIHVLDHPWMSGTELVVDGGLLIRG